METSGSETIYPMTSLNFESCFTGMIRLWSKNHLIRTRLRGWERYYGIGLKYFEEIVTLGGLVVKSALYYASKNARGEGNHSSTLALDSFFSATQPLGYREGHWNGLLRANSTQCRSHTQSFAVMTRHFSWSALRTMLMNATRDNITCICFTKRNSWKLCKVLRGSDRFPTTGSGTPGRTKLRLDVAFNTDLSGLVKYSSQSDRKYDQVKKRLQRLANIEGVTRSTDFTDILPPEPRSQGKVLTPLPDASSGKWFDSTKPRLLENRSMPQIETHPEVSLGASPDIGMSISQMIYRKTLKLLSNIGLRETRHFARPSAG
ncbi:hypothetical protein F5B18DRAFT_558260 [Nemania serpens]|nr:hypothetical protein F5B18DRAFT_558260 [Nemania serpens]